MATAEDIFAKLGSLPGAKVIQPGSSASFTKGEAVVITGLTKKPELNGREAVVLGPEADGRYPVQLTDGPSIKAKPENLRSANPEAKKPAPLPNAHLPIMYDFKANMEYAADSSHSDEDRITCLKALVGHAESQLPEHHKKLIDAGLHSKLLAVARRTDDKASVRICAVHTLSVLCRYPDNVGPTIEAGALEVLYPLLTSGGDFQSVALDAIGTMSNFPDGKLAIGQSPCLNELIAICRDDGASAELRASVMSALGQLIHHQKCWPLLVDAGAIGAATSMLRSSSTSPEGAGYAVGLCYLLVMTGFAGKVRDESGCMEALHQAAQGRHGASAAATATKAIQLVVEKGAKAQALEDSAKDSAAG